MQAFGRIVPRLNVVKQQITLLLINLMPSENVWFISMSSGDLERQPQILLDHYFRKLHTIFHTNNLT